MIAAVSDVFPWSTCPIVPMFTCGFVLSNFSFAIASPQLTPVKLATVDRSGAHDQDRTGDLVLTKDALYRLSYVGPLPASELVRCPPRHLLAPEPAVRNIRRGAGDGIRTRDIQLGRLELYQLSYTRLVSTLPRRFAASVMVGREGFEPSKPVGRQIYSLLRLTASLPPRNPATARRSAERLSRVDGARRWSWRRELNPRPADYKSAALPLSYASDERRSLATVGMHDPAGAFGIAATNGDFNKGARRWQVVCQAGGSPVMPEARAPAFASAGAGRAGGSRVHSRPSRRPRARAAVKQDRGPPGPGAADRAVEPIRRRRGEPSCGRGRRRLRRPRRERALSLARPRPRARDRPRQPARPGPAAPGPRAGAAPAVALRRSGPRSRSRSRPAFGAEGRERRTPSDVLVEVAHQVHRIVAASSLVVRDPVHVRRARSRVVARRRPAAGPSIFTERGTLPSRDRPHVARASRRAGGSPRRAPRPPRPRRSASHLAEQRERDQVVAALAHQPADAPSLAARARARAAACSRLASHRSRAAPRRSPITHRPRAFKASSACARLPTRATRTCSSAPRKLGRRSR